MSVKSEFRLDRTGITCLHCGATQVVTLRSYGILITEHRKDYCQSAANTRKETRLKFPLMKGQGVDAA